MWTREGVKQLRARLGISQVVLAGLIKMDVQTVQAWEQGRCSISRRGREGLDRVARREAAGRKEEAR